MPSIGATSQSEARAPTLYNALLNSSTRRPRDHDRPPPSRRTVPAPGRRSRGWPAIVALDLERNFRALLEAGLSRLDLVTREELDVQQAVLLRTRQRLEQMEARVAELERAAGIQRPQADQARTD